MIDYDEVGGCFTLIEEKVDNPIIYYYYGLGDLVSSSSKFVEYIRWAIFERVISLLKTSNLNVKNITNFEWLFEQKWVTFYFSKIKDKKFWFRYNETRAIFHQMMYESGEIENRILSIIEWENLFVEYLED